MSDEHTDKEKREREIARLESYSKYGVNSPYQGMHFRSPQRKYPGVVDAHFADSARGPSTPPLSGE
jgi:hypothetical protein